jgi:hypothetical protein
MFRIYKRLYNEVNNYLEAFLENIAIELTSKQFLALKDLRQTFFVVGVPGSLHLVELSLRYIPSGFNVVFISNGMDKWEQAWAMKHLGVHSIITIDKLLIHAKVMDLIFDNFSEAFGILDYDCFIFNPSYFSRITSLESNSMLNALFVYKNLILNIEIPETFFLYFNTPIIKSLKQKYHVNCNLYKYPVLSRKVKQQLATIGIDENHYPEHFKNYFDTFRLLLCLGIADGYQVNFIDKFPTVSVPSNEVFHVGGVARPNNINSNWQMRGSYLWRRALEVNKDCKLRQRYWEKFGDISAKELLVKYPGYKEKIGLDFIDFVEKIVFRESPIY